MALADKQMLHDYICLSAIPLSASACISRSVSAIHNYISFALALSLLHDLRLACFAVLSQGKA